jgi:hypothetical protein
VSLTDRRLAAETAGLASQSVFIQLINFRWKRMCALGPRSRFATKIFWTSRRPNSEARALADTRNAHARDGERRDASRCSRGARSPLLSCARSQLGRGVRANVELAVFGARVRCVSGPGRIVSTSRACHATGSPPFAVPAARPRRAHLTSFLFFVAFFHIRRSAGHRLDQIVRDAIGRSNRKTQAGLPGQGASRYAYMFVHWLDVFRNSLLFIHLPCLPRETRISQASRKTRSSRRRSACASQGVAKRAARRSPRHAPFARALWPLVLVVLFVFVFVHAVAAVCVRVQSCSERGRGRGRRRRRAAARV